MITVFGLGFVGLTTALGFAHYGYEVYGVDVDEDKKTIIRQGKVPFLEEGLDLALKEHLGKNFMVVDDAVTAVQNSDYIFYCVGTPCGESGEAELKYLFTALEETLHAREKDKPHVLVIKSTIPPGTTSDKIVPFLESKGLRIGQDVLLTNNPEFLREGKCWEDFIHADRIVVGCNEAEGARRLRELYEPFSIPFYPVSYSTAEFIKYLSNSMLAALISFSNEMANVAYAVGDIDVQESFKIFHMDKRWNNGTMASYAYPGCGYGGYCLPKDTNALYAVSKGKGTEAKILGQVIEMNDRMPEIISDRIVERVSSDARIGILGLSFKPGSNDVRDSASAKIINKLMGKGYRNLIAYDPVAIPEFKAYYNPNIDYADDLNEVTEQSDLMVILTGWDEFIPIKRSYPDKVVDYRYLE